MREIGTKLREARMERALSQAELVRLTPGVSQAQISMIETGKRAPSLKTLARLLAVLGKRIEFVNR